MAAFWMAVSWMAASWMVAADFEQPEKVKYFVSGKLECTCNFLKVTKVNVFTYK